MVMAFNIYPAPLVFCAILSSLTSYCWCNHLASGGTAEATLHLTNKNEQRTKKYPANYISTQWGHKFNFLPAEVTFTHFFLQCNCDEANKARHSHTPPSRTQFAREKRSQLLILLLLVVVLLLLYRVTCTYSSAEQWHNIPLPPPLSSCSRTITDSVYSCPRVLHLTRDFCCPCRSHGSFFLFLVLFLFLPLCFAFSHSFSLCLSPFLPLPLSRRPLACHSLNTHT